MAAVIDAPPAVPPRLSLLEAADTPQDAVDRWLNLNVEYQPHACEGSSAFTFDPCDPGEKPEGERVATETVKPFGVGYVYECDSRSGYQPGEFRTRAREEFDAWQPKLIEQQVWEATAITTNPDLVGATTIIPAAVAGLDPIPALGCLTQELRNCGHGGPGMIHATSQLVNEWVAAGLVIRANRWKGDLLYTGLDDVVVPGSGYDGSPPGAVAPQTGIQWAYATRIMQIRLSPVTFVPGAVDDRQWMREALDRSVNTIRVVVERAVLAIWDPCCTIAVRVNVQGCSTGS
jgi:hypothetical protein